VTRRQERFIFCSSDFSCTGNSARSIIAEDMLRANAHPDDRIPRQGRGKAFLDTAETMKRRPELFLALPMDKLGRRAIQRQVKDIGAR
jgi:hypothetical protein